MTIIYIILGTVICYLTAAAILLLVFGGEA